MRWILANSELRNQLSRGGLKLSQTVFDKQIIASQLAKLYFALVGSAAMRGAPPKIEIE